MCLGQKPDINLKQNCFGGQCNILTEKEGNSSTMIYYNRLPKSCNILIEPNRNITQFSQYGRVIAQIELFGKSYAEIKNRADEIRQKVMKNNREI